MNSEVLLNKSFKNTLTYGLIVVHCKKEVVILELIHCSQSY